MNIIDLLSDRKVLDKIYGFAYKRCNSSHEAEDLSSDIIFALLKSIRKNPSVDHFYAFLWTIAHRTYANYCEKRKSHSNVISAEEYTDKIINLQTYPINQYLETEEQAELISKIKREIAFLSKIYRDVMVKYYLDEMKIYEIAKSLAISETAVKQRLFSARNNIKKEVEKMDNMDNKNLSLKPIKISFFGTGKPVGNDPSQKAERMLSQNLVFLCRDTSRSAKEISELLNIPMIFVEDEIEIQCHGLNGHYGLLKKLDNGKYISNFILIDTDKFNQVYNLYKNKVSVIADKLEVYLQNNNNKILNFPFLSNQKDIKFITWSLISRMLWKFESEVFNVLKNKYLSEIEIQDREFYIFGIASNFDENINFGCYGCDGIYSRDICGYSSVSLFNIYGKRIEKHFACGHDVSIDPLLLLTIKSIGGIDRNTLNEEESETAAKAIEAGYLKVETGKLYPQILVIDIKDEKAFYSLSEDFGEELKDIIEATVDDLYNCIQKCVPKHLMSEYHQFIKHTSFSFMNDLFETCIQKGLLNIPENRLCAEGTWMIITK